MGDGLDLPGDRDSAVTPSAVDTVVEGLRTGIKAGRFAPGQRLVEATLMTEFSVGRNAVREALSRLRSDGLVAVEAHRGATVRRLDRQDVAQLYLLREALEGFGARLAAKTIDEPGNRKRFETAIEQMRASASSGDLTRYLDDNVEYHRAIVELSGNPRLIELVDQLHVQTFRVQIRHMLARFAPHLREAEVVEHDAVAKAILSGDAETAERAMREHMRHMRESILALPDIAFH